MSIAPWIAERFAEISTILLHIFFLHRTLSPKGGVRKQLLLGFIFACMRMIYYALGFGFRPYFSVLTAIFYASLALVGDIKSYTIWSIILVALDGIVDATVINLYLLFPNTHASLVMEPGPIRIMIILITKIVLFAVYYFITRKVDKEHEIRWRDSITLIIVPVGCWILLEIVFQFGDMLSNSLPLLASGGIVLLLTMVSVVVLYNRITADGKELAQSKLQLRTAEMTQDHIVQINSMYGELSSIRHDLHNHFAAISGYLNAKDYGALKQYVEGLIDIEMDTPEYSKHPVLNILISSRMAMAQNLNIDFTSNIILPDQIPITDVDLCILVSNMLDNSIEANEKSAMPRFINLYARIENAYWVVGCRNSTYNQGRFRAVGSLKSTKETAGIHGIGTKQIQKIAEKTGGFVTYRHENYQFSTLAMIKMPD